MGPVAAIPSTHAGTAQKGRKRNGCFGVSDGDKPTFVRGDCQCDTGFKIISTTDC
jgi:hypothetical protein